MNSQRVTMRQVAAEAGVAVMTVSYTYQQPERVAETTRTKVLEAAERLGYRGPNPVARSLRSGSTGNLGVVLGEHLTYAFEDPQAAKFLAGVSRVCVEHRLGLVLIPSTGEASDVDRVQEATVDGFVVWTTVRGDPVLDAVAATGRPAAIQGGPAVPGIQVVTADDQTAAHAIAHHMLEDARNPIVLSHPLGRARQAGLFWGPNTDVAFPVTRARLTGYKQAYEELGHSWSDVPVAVVARHTRDNGRQAMTDVLDKFRPDVVIAMSDQLAAGAIDVLGRTVRVSGWDDSELASTLGFPSIRQSLFEQGVACANIAAGITRVAIPPPWRLALH
ncbi:DNA-binding LacI/PurR family transcriptional regulator [Arthrobacter sp. CAN_A6]|uniref:LacI family DNA-binding transcriptional regulator n=1 Tax=Arthrobacter sp. CAN_A6 TaxID=2787721 RepID=UPI0018CBCA4A